MKLVLDEKQKAKMKKDGSTLKYMYGVAGIGKGLTAGGWCLFIAGVPLTALVSGAGLPQALVMGAIFFLPAFLLIFLGGQKQKKHDDGWVEAFMYRSKLPKEDVLQAEAEFTAPDTVIVGFDGTSKNGLQKAGFITAHYFKAPGIQPMLYRLEDMVACFHTDKYLCQDGGYAKALIIYAQNPEDYFEIVDISKKKADILIDAVKAANPSVITSQFFIFGEQTYDALNQKAEVIALHNRVMSRQAYGEGEDE